VGMKKNKRTYASEWKQRVRNSVFQPLARGIIGMRNSNAVTFSKERRDEMIVEIKNYFLHEREEDLGDLAAGLILDFVVETLAPEFYNQGVLDSYQFLHDTAEDLLSIQK